MAGGNFQEREKENRGGTGENRKKKWLRISSGGRSQASPILRLGEISRKRDKRKGEP